MPWRILRNPINGALYARIECSKCRQTVETFDPDKAVLVHCGKREFLTIPQREQLASGKLETVDAALAEQGRANFAALEAAKNQQIPHHFNEAAAFEREVAQMRRDAEALEAKRRQQAEYDLRTPLPRQPTGETPQREQYLPGVKDV